MMHSLFYDAFWRKTTSRAFVLVIRLMIRVQRNSHPRRVYSRPRYSPERSVMTGACTFCDIEPSNRGIKFEGEYPPVTAKPGTEDQESDIKFKFSNNRSATDTHALGAK